MLFFRYMFSEISICSIIRQYGLTSDQQSTFDDILSIKRGKYIIQVTLDFCNFMLNTLLKYNTLRKQTYVRYIDSLYSDPFPESLQIEFPTLIESQIQVL